jgi:hypothetical protein
MPSSAQLNSSRLYTVDMNLQTPAVRWGIGLYGGLIVAAVSFLYLEGLPQLIGFAMALVHVVVTPLLLKRRTESS